MLRKLNKQNPKSYRMEDFSRYVKCFVVSQYHTACVTRQKSVHKESQDILENEELINVLSFGVLSPIRNIYKKDAFSNTIDAIYGVTKENLMINSNAFSRGMYIMGSFIVNGGN